MSKILIIEDEQKQRDSLKVFLQENNFAVDTASDGESGIKIAREWIPDVLILDLMLPTIDGVSVCRILFRDPALSMMSILICSARGAEMDKIVLLESGADDYLVKPIDLGELLARVKTLIRRKTRHEVVTNEIHIGNVSVDIPRRQVHLNGKEVYFPNMQFSVLLTLMKSAGIVLSRDLLLNQIWGTDYMGDPRTVDIHVRWIREKIELDPSKPEKIITVRGVGYRYNKE